jgi:DNA-binding transcriptional LysR family regulator
MDEEHRDGIDAGWMMDTESIRRFVVVAEELNFGRAAERLGIAQPPLSRAIAKLERRLGVGLLDRSGRQVALTAAGEVLLTEGRKALDAVLAATLRAQRAGQPRLVLAVKPGGDGGLLPEIMSRYEAHPGSLPVDLVFSAIERSAMLRDGRADIALMHRPPNDLAGLDSEDLLAERPVVLLPARHPLAVVPESVRDRVPPGVACRDVADAPATTLVIAWPRDSRSPQVAAFVQAAAEAAAAR